MGVNLLLSYALCADTDIARVRRGMVCGRLMIDSGAFSVYTKGITIDRTAYAEYLERWRSSWDYAVTLDVVGNPELTRVNTRWLQRRGLDVMPVFTLGMTLADFDAMVKDSSYVCVGGLINLKRSRSQQISRIRMLQRRAQDMGGGVHALGVGSVATIRDAQPFSADASTPTSVTRYGNIVIFDEGMLRQVHVSSPAALAKYRNVIRANGIDVAVLARLRRLPGKDDGATGLAVSMAMTYIVADEYVKRKWSAPEPGGGDDTGPHLYHSTDSATALSVARLDQMIHDDGPKNWPLWAIHGRHHRCRTRKEQRHA